MDDTHGSRLNDGSDAAGHEVLRTPHRHRNRGALQRALRQERVARRRYFFGWLLIVLLAVGAGGAIVYWIAGLTTSNGLRPPSSTAAPADANDPLPAGVVSGLPSR